MIRKVRADKEGIATIKSGDAESVHNYFSRHPERILWFTPFAGATWLHYAADVSNPDVLAVLIELGLDVNVTSLRDAARVALIDACYTNNVPNALFLLDRGSRMDTDASVRNPIFAAIVGKSPEIIQLLLDRGIDATVRYDSETMVNMDALAFALWHGERNLAEIIAQYLSRGDENERRRLLAEASDVASRNQPLVWRRIVPTESDLSDLN